MFFTLQVNTYIGDEHLNSNERLLHALLADPLVKVTISSSVCWCVVYLLLSIGAV